MEFGPHDKKNPSNNHTYINISDGYRQKESIVLVFSQLGISRSATIVLAYLMHHFKWSLKVRSAHWSNVKITFFQYMYMVIHIVEKDDRKMI